MSTTDRHGFPLRTVYLTIELSSEEIEMLGILLRAGIVHVRTCPVPFGARAHSDTLAKLDHVHELMCKALILPTTPAPAIPTDTLPKMGTAAVSLD